MINILLCDDDEGNRLTTGALLEEVGFEVDLASSFAEAEARLSAASAQYLLLILDQNLGDGLGSELAVVARARLPAAKIVLLTGADRVDALAVDRVVQKGCGFDGLWKIIQALLGR